MASMMINMARTFPCETMDELVEFRVVFCFGSCWPRYIPVHPYAMDTPFESVSMRPRGRPWLLLMFCVTMIKVYYALRYL